MLNRARAPVVLTIVCVFLPTLVFAQDTDLLSGIVSQLTRGSDSVVIADGADQAQPPTTMIMNRLTWRFGWLGGRNGGALEFTAKDADLSAINDFSHTLDMSGLWVKREWESVLSNRWVMTVSGSYLNPAIGDSRESYDRGAAHRTWEARPQWWNLDARAAYLAYDSVLLAGGFRYDNFATNFSDPRAVQGMADSPQDEADTTVSIWQPYVGISVRRITPGSTVTVGAHGFPCLPGNLDYKETLGGSNQRLHGFGSFRSGYLVEAYAEWITRVVGMQVGCFGRFLTMNGTGNATVELKQASGAGLLSEDFEFSYQRSVWIVGAGFQFAFAALL